MLGRKSASIRTSHWNNPEPEIVLAVNSRGQVRGATLGNDVNLRDFEGRSALLLGKAKDNNASCAIGPFIRLFDEHFSLDEVRRCDLALQVTAANSFLMQGSSSMSQISRDPLELVQHALGPITSTRTASCCSWAPCSPPRRTGMVPARAFTHGGRCGDGLDEGALGTW